MNTTSSSDKGTAAGLTPEKREDLWAILIASGVLVASLVAPEAIHNFFKNLIYLL